MAARVNTAPVELARNQLAFPTNVNNYVLTGTAKTVTVPAGMTWALISVSALCYVNGTAAATVPAGDATDGTGSLPISPQYGIFFNVRGLASFSIIGTAVAGVGWYRDHGDI